MLARKLALFPIVQRANIFILLFIMETDIGGSRNNKKNIHVIQLKAHLEQANMVKAQHLRGQASSPPQKKKKTKIQ